jgi:hypothetical protein
MKTPQVKNQEIRKDFTLNVMEMPMDPGVPRCEDASYGRIPTRRGFICSEQVILGGL